MGTKKICIIGGESTYKTTLSKNLSNYFNYPWIEEYAISYFKNRDFDKNPFCESDFIKVAIGQLDLEKKSIDENKNSSLIICDTCPLVTLLWSDKLIGYYSNELLKIVRESKYDLYLFLDYKTKWVDDELRLIPEEKEREIFQSKLIEKCKDLEIKYHLLDGSYVDRERRAIKIIQDFTETILK
ncbi:hypothetical protein RB653_006688 [Dictyostelium firmibasis]|uniref:NadR/Ttd14 AAA domain-containing protein n=1 Tax=Dictyostelium firmibasis TaxID=79012 RepID=A0AAN7YWI2_9MYCE